MPTEIQYRRGTSHFSEDLPIFFPFGSKLGRFGAADGVTGIYTSEEGPIFYDERTGAQLASATLLTACAAAPFGMPIETIIENSNAAMADFVRRAGLNSVQSEFLPAVGFVLADIAQQRLAQTGDCLAVWQTKSGHIRCTPNPMLEYEREMQRQRDRLIEKHSSDQAAAMQEFFASVVTRARRENINREGGYAILNGQPELYPCIRWYKLPSPDELSLILLFTDGLVTVEDTARPDFGEWFLSLYERGGFDAILASTRKEEDRVKKRSHEHHAEATLVVWEPK